MKSKPKFSIGQKVTVLTSQWIATDDDLDGYFEDLEIDGTVIQLSPLADDGDILIEAEPYDEFPTDIRLDDTDSSTDWVNVGQLKTRN